MSLSVPVPFREQNSLSLASLADLFYAVTSVDDAPSILAATMRFLEKWNPKRARIVALLSDESGRPKTGQTLAEWQLGQLLVDSPDYTILHPIADFPLIAAWDGKLATPAFFADIEQDPRIDETLRSRTRAAGCNAAVLIPLYNNSYGGWQGVLKIFWEQAHPFSAEEQDLYRLLMTALSSHIGGLFSQQRLGAALSDLELLQELSRKLNHTETLDEVLHVLSLPAPAREKAHITLSAFESDTSGKRETQPDWITVIGTLSVAGEPPPTAVGTRFFLPDIPFAKYVLSNPDSPLLLSDVRTDPRVDEHTRSIFAASNTRATLVMALTVQGRWVGLLSVIWRHPVSLGEREARVYKSLAKHAALRVDNSLMVDRLSSLLEETRRQSTVLRTVLDNIPAGIVFTEAPSGRLIFSNPAAVRLLGRDLDPKATKEQYSRTYSLVRPGSDESYPYEELPDVRAMETGVPHTAEVDILPPNQGRINLEAIGVPMCDASGKVKNVVIVLSDITARKRAEEERRRLQDEAMRAQAAALAERSSPLIPITNDILVLPIIGSIDTERGQQVLETVLHGTSQSRARVAIIDITGVRTVDTQAASALTNAAQALRLLGVEPVLTGIKPEVAQTLVGLGVGLAGITTRSTLQAGIQYALRHLNKSLLA